MLLFVCSLRLPPLPPLRVLRQLMLDFVHAGDKRVDHVAGVGGEEHERVNLLAQPAEISDNRMLFPTELPS